MEADSLTAWAAGVSERFIRPLGRRWMHVRGVARLAEVVGQAMGDESEVLVAAAYLHDIGYAAELAQTGFHPLDGARFVRSMGELAPGGLGCPPLGRA